MDQPPVSKLKIESLSSPRGLVLVGDIDSHTAPPLGEALAEFDADADVTVAMAKVDFVDSTGLRVLVSHHQRLDAVGHQLILYEPSNSVRRLLDITGLTGTMHTSGGSTSADAP